MLGLHHDAAQEAWYWPDIAAEIDQDGDCESLKFQIEAEIEKRAKQKASIVVGYVFCTILGYSNPRLALIAYCIAHGLGGLGQSSIQEHAKKLGVTKQALSKEITWFRDVCSIEAMGALKSNGARIKYKKAQNERYKVNGSSKRDCHFGFRK